MLEVCRLPRTLSEHSKALIRVGIVETALGITALLDHFVDIHLLVRSSRSGEIGASVLGAPADSTSGRTMTVAFITRDRPQHLRRALMAFGENFRRCGHSPQVVVVDASRRPDSIISTARTATAFRKEFGLAISIVGDDEKADLNRAIMRRLGRQESHESAFLLGLNSNSEESEVGASMNYLLLTCGGKLLCRIDDDILPRFFSKHPLSEGSEFHLSDDEPFLGRYPTREATMDGRVEHDLDCLGEIRRSISNAHSYLKGIDCWASTRGRAPLPRSGQFDGHNLATMSFGTVGDCGAWSNEFIVEHLKRAARRTRAYGSSVELDPTQGREIFRCFDRHTISATPGFNSMFTAFVSSPTTAPFFPRYRNSDGIWAFTVSRCANSLHASLPYAVLHSPPLRPQTFNVDWFSPVYVLPVHFVVLALVQYASECMARSLATVGVVELGRNLVELTSERHTEFSFVCTSAISLRLILKTAIEPQARAGSASRTAGFR